MIRRPLSAFSDRKGLFSRRSPPWRACDEREPGKEVKQVLKEELREFGKELRGMRKEMHMTQEKMAETLGVDPRMISRYETGNAEMGALQYRKVLGLYKSWKNSRAESLLQQIRKLSSEQRGLIEGIIYSMK